MKHIISSAALLVLTSGLASAEVTLSGDARMGLIGNGDDVYFTHRVRAKFTLSGESDSGFSFGASFRPSNAVGAADGYAGEVFISGAFGTLTMGDIDNAAQAVVGQVDGAGLTGLGDLNEISYLGDNTTSARYDYASGGLSFSASIGQMSIGDDSHSVAVAYAMDGYKFSVGYESNSDVIYVNYLLPSLFWHDAYSIDNHVVLGADATIGAVTVKARYGTASTTELWSGAGEFRQYALSATYAMDALSLTAFASARDLNDGDGDYFNLDNYGVGLSYDLGGGAMLKAGYASSKLSSFDDNEMPFPISGSFDIWDLGLSFEF